MTSDPPYRLAPSVSRGLGPFATRDLSPGTRRPEIPVKLARLSPADRATFTAFTDAYSDPPTPATIFKTNALPLGCGSPIGGMFPLACRINHSCAPNVHHAWNDLTHEETIYAIAPIKAGEELFTTAYLSPYAPRAERQKDLQDKFNFTCLCPVCSSGTPDEVAASEARRTRIAALDDLIASIAARNPSRGVALTRERLRLLDAEGLSDAAERSRIYYDAFQACVVVVDYDSARVQASLAFAFRVICEGPGSEDAHAKLAYYVNPVSHPAAGMKGKREVMAALYDACGKTPEGGKGPKDKVKRCGACSVAVYCSKECQVAHWTWHKAACGVLKTLKGQV